MKIGGFKMGKSKEGNGKDNAASGNPKVTQIAGLEEQLNGRTSSLKKTEDKLKKLSSNGKNGKGNNDILARPHGPIGELSINEEDDQTEIITAEKEPDAIEEKSAGGIKLVEVKATIPPPPEKAAKVEPKADDLNSLFASDDEEENPLASLIRTLPDVETNELMEDLKEIKEIIKDWQKK